MKSTLKELRQQQASPMISIILSTQRKSFAEKVKLKLKLKNQVNQAIKEIQVKYDELLAKKLSRSIKALANQVNLDHVGNGIGIYVAPGFEKLVSLPFAVNNKVVVGNTFEVSDIQNTLDKMIDYSVVLLSRQLVRLFKGAGNKLEEINDPDFPFHYEQQFQIHRTSPHSLYNIEESDIDKAREDNYYRKVENLLTPYVKGSPILFLGTVKSLTDFKAISKNKYHVLAEFVGNYDKFKKHQISALVWPEIEKYLQEEKQSTF